MNTESSEMGTLIDRLVCGDIEECDRERLVKWLEEDPVRWRLCGLAFLESQLWSFALRTWPEASQPVAHDDARRVCGPLLEAPIQNVASPAFGGSVSSQRSHLMRIGYAGLLAACLLGAFGLGLLLRGAVPGR